MRPSSTRGPIAETCSRGSGPFAIERGLVEARDGETLVRVFNVNTRAVIHARVPTPGRQVQYEGEVAIGMEVEMVFRRLGTADGIHNYFWKARPVR